MAKDRTGSREVVRRARPALLEAMERRLLLDSVIINEIHYDPDIKTEPAEFVELYNTTADPIDISQWALTDGIEYEFPETTILPGHGYVVVAEDPPTIFQKYGVTAFGPFVGKLENDGERLVLRDDAGVKVDEVDYGAGFPWPTVGEAPGYSIELINPALDNDLAGSWRASAAGSFMPETLIADGEEWMYFKGITEPSPGNEWRQIVFAETGWNPATLAIGYSNEQNELEFIETVLDDMKGGYTTVYLRKEFTVADPESVTALELLTQYDDGVNVWINGTYTGLGLNTRGENRPYDDTAGSAIENTEFVNNLLIDPAPSSYLREGTNVIAVQLFNASLSGSSDAFFDCILRTAWAGDDSATPGAQNSAYAANAAPQMRQVDHSPNEPASGEDVTITIKVTDPDGVGSVTLAYQTVDPGDYISIEDPRYNDPAYWTSGIPMTDDGTGGDAAAGDDVYTAVIPASVQTNRRLVRYRITATDTLGASITGPYADDPQPNFAYYVYDGVPSWTGSARPGVEPEIEYSSALLESLPVYTLITQRQDRLNAMYVPYRYGESDQMNPTSGKYGGSDYKWHGTLVYDGVVYDHIRYRARGGVWRYAMGKNMWKFDFNRNHWFQAHDDYGEPYDVQWDKLNFSALIQQGNYWHRGEQGLFEAVGFKMFNLVGSEAPYTNFLHFRIVDDADEGGPDQFSTDFQGLYMTIEQPDGRLLEEHDLPDGNFYKMEGGTGELNNQGPTQPTDKSDLVAFMNGYSSSPSEQWWRDNFDLRRYYSYRSVVECIHHYDIAYGKNYFYYNNPETGKWQIHVWDIDLTWADNMYGNGNHVFKSLVADRYEFRPEYRSRMREVRDLLYNTEQMGILIDEFASFIYTAGQLSWVDADCAMWDYNPILVSNYVRSDKAGHGRFYAGNPPSIVIPDPPGGFAGMAQKMKNYVVSRGAWIDSTILDDEYLTPYTPTITYTGLGGYPADGLTFQCSSYADPQGNYTFGAMQWRIAEVTIPGTPEFDPSDPRKYEIEADWQSDEITSFNSTVAVPKDVAKTGHRYRVRVRMRDTDGHWSHWSAPVEFVAGPAMGSAVPLRITEIMYNPAERDTTPGNPEEPFTNNNDFEYVELKNIGASAVNLAGIRFTEGVHFTFGSMALNPGEFVLVVRDSDAFEARYGTGHNIAGEFLDDTSLGNGGDDLLLLDPLGFTIHDFDYADGWFPHTDGEGFSLVVRDATQDTDLWDSKDGWRASWALHGNPGQADPSPVNPGDVVLNELLAHTDGADGDWVELKNATDSAIDLTGWFLSDDPGNLLKYRIGSAAPVSIPGGGLVVFTEAAHFGDTATDPGRLVPFAFSEFGEVVGDALLLTSSPDGVHPGGYREDEYFGPSLGEVSFGRYEKPSGGKDFVPVASPTFEAPNAAPLIPDVVINEIMYNPDPGGHEFIELANRTDADVPLHDDQPTPNPWMFTDGVTYTFPTDAYVPAGGYALVVGIDPATFRSTYGVPPSIPVYGPWDGALANEGERIELCFPGAPEWFDPPPGEPVPYIPYVLAEKITYDDRSPWPATPDGGGPSLERLDPDVYGNDVANWGASLLTGGTQGWANGAGPPSVTVSVTAVDADAREQARDPGSFRILRTGSTAGPLIVYYGMSGTAVGADYEPALPGWVEIPAGQSYATITVAPIDDLDPEPTETLVLTLVPDAAYLIGTSDATIMIADNDGYTPDVAVHMVATDPDAAEQDADAGTFTVYRVGSSPDPLTVRYTVGGTAVQADYEETLSGTVIIQPTETFVSFDVTPVDDSDLEPDETVQLTITPDPSYLVGTSSAIVTIADNDDVPPVVTGVALNPDPGRPERGVSAIDPSGLGVETIRITFSEDVTFILGDVTAEKVTFDALGNEISSVPVVPASVEGSGTGEMTITFADAWQETVDTWVRITLADTITDASSRSLDGEPAADSSGLGYIYDADLDLPSGDGTEGGDAVFYVGSLRADMRGFGPDAEEPNGTVDSWDITGFTQKYLAGSLDADFRGFGPDAEEPNGSVDSWDINGFTSRYTAAIAAGTHLEDLPTSGGGGMALGAPAPLPLAADEGVAWPRSCGHAFDGTTGTIASERPVAMPAAVPPALADAVPAGHVAVSAEGAEPESALWLPPAPDTTATDPTLTADGGVVDLLAAPALEVALGA